MKRRVFNLLTGMSLLCCAAVTTATIESFFHTDSLIYTTNAKPPMSFGMTFVPGAIAFDVSTAFRQEVRGSLRSGNFVAREVPLLHPLFPVGFFYRRLSAHVAKSAFVPQYESFHIQTPMPTVPLPGGAVTFLTVFRARQLALPDWALLAAMSILPCWWWICRKRFRWPAGHCHLCGYDLRATPHGCPECGNPLKLLS